DWSSGPGSLPQPGAATGRDAPATAPRAKTWGKIGPAAAPARALASCFLCPSDAPGASGWYAVLSLGALPTTSLNASKIVGAATKLNITAAPNQVPSART